MISWGKEVYETGPGARLSANFTGQRVKEVCSDKHSQRIVPLLLRLQPRSRWDSHSSRASD